VYKLELYSLPSQDNMGTNKRFYHIQKCDI